MSTCNVKFKSTVSNCTVIFTLFGRPKFPSFLLIRTLRTAVFLSNHCQSVSKTTMRSRFRRPHERTFRVHLIVHQLDSIPVIHRLLYVQWRARRSHPSDGRTQAQPVEPGNVVRWNATEVFTVIIPAESADMAVLQPSPLMLELRSERKGRWAPSYHAEGRVDLDLSEVAAVGSISRNFLVQESLLNTTLKLTVRLTHQSGDKIFRTRTLPEGNNPGASPHASTPTASTPPGNNSSLDLASLVMQADEDPSLSQTEAIAISPPQLPLLPLASLESDAPISLPCPPPDRVTPSSLMCNVNVHTAPRSSTSSLPRLAATSGPSTSSSLLHVLEKDTSPSHFVDAKEHSASTVLEKGIPNPERSQQHIYESIFQKRMRDAWPCYVVNSRVDAAQVVNDVYGSVCAADGIGVATPSSDCTKMNDGGHSDSGNICPDQSLDELPLHDGDLFEKTKKLSSSHIPMPIFQ